MNKPSAAEIHARAQSNKGLEVVNRVLSENIRVVQAYLGLVLLGRTNVRLEKNIEKIDGQPYEKSIHLAIVEDPLPSGIQEASAEIETVEQAKAALSRCPRLKDEPMTATERNLATKTP